VADDKEEVKLASQDSNSPRNDKDEVNSAETVIHKDKPSSNEDYLNQRLTGSPKSFDLFLVTSSYQRVDEVKDFLEINKG